METIIIHALKITILSIFLISPVVLFLIHIRIHGKGADRTIASILLFNIIIIIYLAPTVLQEEKKASLGFVDEWYGVMKGASVISDVEDFVEQVHLEKLEKVVEFHKALTTFIETTELMELNKLETPEQWVEIVIESEGMLFPYIAVLVRTFEDNPLILEQLAYYGYSIEKQVELWELLEEQQKHILSQYGPSQPYSESKQFEILNAIDNEKQQYSRLLEEHQSIQPPSNFEYLHFYIEDQITSLELMTLEREIYEFNVLTYYEDGVINKEESLEIQEAVEWYNEAMNILNKIMENNYMLVTDELVEGTEHIGNLITSEMMK